MNIISHNKPCVGEEEITAMSGVIRKKHLIAGEEVHNFEKSFKKYIGRKFALAVNSGTSALHLSLLALNITKGDQVIIPTYTSADLLNAIYYVGAEPLLVDIENNSCSISIKNLEKKITSKTKAVIIPHTFGSPVNIPFIEKYGIPVIEDCAQTVGSSIDGKKVGTFGLLSIFSFYATKLLTTGQGGMVLTDDKQKYEYIKDLINYNGRDNYKVRYNYPLTDIAASIGNVQLKKFYFFCERRKQIASIYQRLLIKKQIKHWPTQEDTNVIPFRFLLRFANGEQAEAMKKIFFTQGVEMRYPIERYELLHNLLHMNKKDFPNAEAFAKTSLSLPIYPCLTDDEIEKILFLLSTLL